MAGIVVGVDGSAHAERAARWAADEARLRAVPLRVVHVAAQAGRTPATGLTPPGPEQRELRELDRDLVVEESLADVDLADLEVERLARPGHPVEVLCDLARDADLLVVGARGLGGFRGLLLGSVTQQVVAHAPCPVVVVVPEDR